MNGQACIGRQDVLLGMELRAQCALRVLEHAFLHEIKMNMVLLEQNVEVLIVVLAMEAQTTNASNDYLDIHLLI